MLEGEGGFADMILSGPFARPQWRRCDVFSGELGSKRRELGEKIRWLSLGIMAGAGGIRVDVYIWILAPLRIRNQRIITRDFPADRRRS